MKKITTALEETASNMTQETARMRNSCRETCQVVRVLFWLTLLFGVCCAVYTGILALQPSGSFTASVSAGSGEWTFRSGGLGFSVGGGRVSARVVSPGDPSMIFRSVKGAALLSQMTGLVTVFWAALLFHFLIQFLRSAAEGESPFQVNNARFLRGIAWCILLEAACADFLPLPFLLVLVPRGISVPLENLPSALLISGLIFCVERIFRYGCCLQKEADETL